MNALYFRRVIINGGVGMYLVEHNCKFAISPMLFESFDEAIASMKLYLSMGYEVTLKKLKITTNIKKESIK